MAGCDAARVGAYLDGELPPGEREAFAEHLRTCQDCQKLLACYQALADGLVCADPPETLTPGILYKISLEKAPGGSRRFAWGGFTLAAAAVVVFLLLGNRILPYFPAFKGFSSQREMSVPQEAPAMRESLMEVAGSADSGGGVYGTFSQGEAGAAEDSLQEEEETSAFQTVAPAQLPMGAPSATPAPGRSADAYETSRNDVSVKDEADGAQTLPADFPWAGRAFCGAALYDVPPALSQDPLETSLGDDGTLYCVFDRSYFEEILHNYPDYETLEDILIHSDAQEGLVILRGS